MNVFIDSYIVKVLPLRTINIDNLASFKKCVLTLQHSWDILCFFFYMFCVILETLAIRIVFFPVSLKKNLLLLLSL